MQDLREQLYDIYPQWHIPFWQTPYFKYGVILFLLVVCVSLIALFLSYRSKKAVIDSYVTVARRELDELSSSHLLDPEYAASFYNVLIMSLKKYLTAHFQLDFLSATDRESLQLLKIATHDAQLHALLETIFQGTLQVRFARADRLLSMMKDDLDNSYKILELTQP